MPIHPNGHIAAAAEDADRDRVLKTGRWLIRNGTDRCAVTIGLAILGAVGIEAPMSCSCRPSDCSPTDSGPWQPERGDSLNGYFAGKVAITGRLHEAIGEFGSDPKLVDATSRLLTIRIQLPPLHRRPGARPAPSTSRHSSPRSGQRRPGRLSHTRTG